MHYDVFNGDADGISALLQLRLANPKISELITGVKRDIKLLERVDLAKASSVTALDISMAKNVSPLKALLGKSIPVFYCDHHQTAELPFVEHLNSVIDLSAEICTSLLINNELNGAFAAWAVVGAFGDNLLTQGKQLAEQIGLSVEETAFLQELGTLINYNGYGADLSDLHIAPATLYRQLLEFPDPLALREAFNSPYHQLKAGFAADQAKVMGASPIQETAFSRVFSLPNEAWARRISGVFGNELANQAPAQAHAVLTLNPNEQDYTVSVRAPLNNRVGADELCSAFATGGGRKAAAGINQLPVAEQANFIHQFTQYYACLAQ